jgi:hypothetical protein
MFSAVAPDACALSIAGVMSSPLAKRLRNQIDVLPICAIFDREVLAFNETAAWSPDW